MKKLSKCERRVLRKLGLPPDALLAVSLGLPPDWMCPVVFGNINCNSCGGKLCGQVEKKQC